MNNLNKINVVIIDSGVKLSHSAFQNDCIFVKDILDENGTGIDTYGHGTAIYGIIRKCPEANIYNLKISDIENGIDITHLVKALTFVLHNLPETNIINLSLGVNIVDNDDLYQVCTELTDKGIIIVSAFDNTNCFSYPALYDNVIGVTTSIICKKAE